MIGGVAWEELFDVFLEARVILFRSTFVMFMSLGTLASQIASATNKILELFGGKDAGSMVLGAKMMSFVNGHSGVNDLRFDGLLLNYRLYSLVNVMVNMFTLNGAAGGLAVLSFMRNRIVSELGSFGLKFLFGTGIVVLVAELSMLSVNYVVCM